KGTLKTFLISCRRRHTSFSRDWSSDVCSSDLIDEYDAALDSGRMPVKRALKTTEEERMIREFILQMKLGRVKASYFRDKFGVDRSEERRVGKERGTRWGRYRKIRTE